MRIRLTSQNVNTLPPVGGKRTAYEDVQTPGLVYRVSRRTRAWYLFVNRRGKKECVLLGYYQVPGGPPPMRRVDGPLLTLKQARDAVSVELQKADRGVGTVAQRGAGTVAELVHSAIQAKAVLNSQKRASRPVTIGGYMNLWNVHIAGTPRPPGRGPRKRKGKPFVRTRAPFADLPAGDLTRLMVRTWIAPIAARTPTTANALTKLMKLSYAWAEGEELLGENQLLSLKLPAPKATRGRYLSTAECRALWIALAELRLHTLADATSLLMLTGVRRRNVLEMRVFQFEDLDGAGGNAWPGPRWMLGEAGTKSWRPHVVPLCQQAVEIVQRRIAFARKHGLTYLFPIGGERFGEDQPRGWSSKWDRQLMSHVQAIYGAETPMAPWTVHTIRHTIRTHLSGSLRIPDDVARLVTMHSRGGVDGIYNLAELLDQRRVALVQWADWLDRQVSPPPDKKPSASVSTSR